MYEYQAEVLKVLDGDTLEVSLDLGLGVRYRTPLRMDGINAPEIHSSHVGEKAAGLLARDYPRTSTAATSPRCSRWIGPRSASASTTSWCAAAT